MQQTNQEIKTFLTKVTGRLYKEIKRNSRVNVDYDELYGEMGVTYAAAMKTYDPTRREASFETYAVAACNWGAMTYLKKLVRWYKQDNHFIGTIIGESASPDKMLEVKEFDKRLREDASFNYMIFEDCVAPSQAVRGRMSRPGSSVAKAVSAARGVSVSKVYWTIQVAKKKFHEYQNKA